MFGQTIDYYILKPFTHNRNIATEEQLNSKADEPDIGLDAALRRVEKLQQRLEGRFPIRSDLRYLDVGCGKGDITIALAQRGVKYLTGIDFVERNIVSAKANAERLQVAVQFICEDIHKWRPSHRFDVVLSHEALEHIENPKEFLRKLAEFVEPTGIAVLAFGPLFYSPLGDHMDGFIPCLGSLARGAFFGTGYPASPEGTIQAD